MTATLVLLLGVVPTYGSAASLNGAWEDWTPQISGSDSSATWALLEGLVHTTNTAQTVAEKECDGQTPTTGHATARSNRLVRSASPKRAVQCPIPPVPEQATIQEKNP